MESSIGSVTALVLLLPAAWFLFILATLIISLTRAAFILCKARNSLLLSYNLSRSSCS